MQGLQLDYNGQSYQLNKQRFSVGSHRENDLVVENANFPDFLISFFLADGHWKVLSLNRHYAIKVNNKPLSGLMCINAGDVLSVGDKTFQLTQPCVSQQLRATTAVQPIIVEERSSGYLLSEIPKQKEASSMSISLPASGRFWLSSLICKDSEPCSEDTSKAEDPGSVVAMDTDLEFFIEDEELWIGTNGESFVVNGATESLCQVFVGDQVSWKNRVWNISGPAEKMRPVQSASFSVGEVDLSLHEDSIGVPRSEKVAQTKVSNSNEGALINDLDELVNFRHKLTKWLSGKSDSNVESSELQDPCIQGKRKPNALNDGAFDCSPRLVSETAPIENSAGRISRHRMEEGARKHSVSGNNSLLIETKRQSTQCQVTSDKNPHLQASVSTQILTKKVGYSVLLMGVMVIGMAFILI